MLRDEDFKEDLVGWILKLWNYFVEGLVFKLLVLSFHTKRYKVDLLNYHEVVSFEHKK